LELQAASSQPIDGFPTPGADGRLYDIEPSYGLSGESGTAGHDLPVAGDRFQAC
jgi:hypothetical protein